MVERIRKTPVRINVRLLARLQSKVKRLRNEKDKKFSSNFI